LACALGCCLKLKNQVSVGRLQTFFGIFTYDSYDYCVIGFHFLDILLAAGVRKVLVTDYCLSVTADPQHNKSLPGISLDGLLSHYN
jgi:hypothetical protein